MPSGIVGNHLGTEWKGIKYPFPQLPNIENEIQWIGSLVSPPMQNQQDPDGNRGGFGAVPSGIVGNQLGPELNG